MTCGVQELSQARSRIARCTHPASVLVALAFASGCGGTSVRFTRAQRAPAAASAVVARALLATDRQYSTLTNAGGILLGWVTTDGKEPAELEAAARVYAARQGATHIILIDRASSIDWTASAGPLLANRDHQQVWVAVRVPYQHWNKLPEGLRPQLGIDYVLDPPRSR